MCSAEDRCSECSYLSLLQFQAYVKNTEKHSAKEKKQAKSSGGSSEKRSHRQEPASEALWSSRFVTVESDLATMKTSIGQLSAVLLLLASGYVFSGFADGGASMRPLPRLVPGVAEARSPLSSGPSVAVVGSSGASLSVSPLPGLAPGVSGARLPLFQALPRSWQSGEGVSLSTAPLPSVAPAVSVVQTPTVSGASREFSGLGGMSLRAAPLPSVALGLSGLQAPADPVSSVAGPGVGGLSLCAAPLSGKALGACGEPAPTRSVSSLGLVGGGEMGLHVAPLLGGLLGDGNFAGSAGVSSMGMPHVDWLHGSMPSQVLPQPVDAGADPGGAVVSQAAATGWPSFSEEVDQVFDDVPLGEAVTVDEEGAASFRELITSVRESLGLLMPSSLASTLQTGVVRTSGTSRPGTTPLVLPHSPLALEVCREQLGCSLGISNPVSAKFTLPRRQAVVRNLPNTYGDWERRQLMSSPVGSHLFDGQTLAVVEQRELESSQRSLVSQIACGLSSTAQGIRAKADHAIGSRCLAPVVPPSVPPPPALKGPSGVSLGTLQRCYCKLGLSAAALVRVGEHRGLRVGGMVLFSPSSGILSSRARLWSFWRTRGAQTVIWLWRLRFPRC
ncbi:hypothetical protein E2C01_059174 [Portunus trituberculatus]|uniref:Uncharacterized protein n=1 Tax=Portunus trituberculatus TaxID=210409 RepID=A0A5B7GYG0_PORTR|nr:hypothetical protein [Portunus trituberculatus]